jgi:hypothetical protein
LQIEEGVIMLKTVAEAGGLECPYKGYLCKVDLCAAWVSMKGDVLPAPRYVLAQRYTELLTGKAYYYAGAFIKGYIRRSWLAWLDKAGIGRI